MSCISYSIMIYSFSNNRGSSNIEGVCRAKQLFPIAWLAWRPSTHGEVESLKKGRELEPVRSFYEITWKSHSPHFPYISVLSLPCCPRSALPDDHLVKPDRLLASQVPYLRRQNSSETTMYQFCYKFKKWNLKTYMGVSKNRGGPPKWMVYKGKPY